MRRLNIDDLFLITKIIDKMDFQVPERKKNEDNESWGMRFFYSLTRKLYKADEEVKELIKNVTDKDANKMGMQEIIKTLKAIAEQEGFISFLK